MYAHQQHLCIANQYNITKSNKNCNITNAETIFNCSKINKYKTDIILWNVTLNGYIINNSYKQSFKLFNELINANISNLQPNITTYNNIKRMRQNAIN